MKFYVLNLLAILSVSFGVNAQTYWVKKTQLLNFLYFRNESVNYISTSATVQKILPVDFGNKTTSLNKIIRTSSGLYILIDGTGQVYKATNINKTQIAFTRIDSTTHFGHNYLSINLSWNDTIYSMGGYGFWHVNGQLRYFNSALGDWNCLQLNKEMPIEDNIIYFDKTNGKIFQVLFPKSNEIDFEIKDKQIKAISQVSLKDKNHLILGKLNDFFINEINIRIIHDYWISDKLSGTVAILNYQDTYLFDFINNKAYRAISNKIPAKLVTYDKANRNKNIFQINDTVYFTRSNSDSLYSFTVSRSDFSEEGIPIYIPLNQNFNKILIGSGLFVGMLSFIGFRQYRKKYTTKTNKNIFGKPVHETDPLLFTEVEKNLIQLMINQQTLNVDEVNNLLGLAKKTLEIQKKIRTETLNKINHKFRVLSEEEREFIERIRSEQDRRFYNYTISKENIDIYWKLIK
jgi:hypothetical protein